MEEKYYLREMKGKLFFLGVRSFPRPVDLHNGNILVGTFFAETVHPAHHLKVLCVCVYVRTLSKYSCTASLFWSSIIGKTLFQDFWNFILDVEQQHQIGIIHDLFVN